MRLIFTRTPYRPTLLAKAALGDNKQFFLSLALARLNVIRLVIKHLW